MLKEKIKNLANEYFDEMVAIRRHLHKHPELSYQEFETSKFIQKKLNEWGIKYIAPVAITGILVILEGKNPNKKCVALRADIDALPILEENKVEYISINKGVMHACGHDVHTACLLGAVKILNSLKEHWEGTIKCVFQPGEEKNPGGASLMIKENILEYPTVSSIVGLHVHTTLEVGKFSFREGKAMASADEIYITLRGKGGHAAAPHTTSDTVLAAAHLVIALQQLISRNNDPFNPSVLTISSIQGGSTTNVIPKEVKLMGTFRAMDEVWRINAHQKIQHIVEGVAQSMNVEYDIYIDVGYPMVYNDQLLTQQARKFAEDFIGQENVSETEMRMGAEDFGYYTQKIKGSFFRLGVKNPTLKEIPNVHTPQFNVDEKAIEHGMGMMAWMGVNIK